MNLLPFTLWAVLPAVALGQGAFFNLDFESATVPYRLYLATDVAAAEAFPGWTVRGDNQVRSLVGYNRTLPEESSVNLWAISMGIPGTGLYCAALSPYPFGSCSLAQVGAIPTGATLMLFSTGAERHPELFAISFAGVNLVPTLVSSQAGIWSQTWAVDITSYAGMSGELRFTSNTLPDGMGGWLSGGCSLDDITFVPEPGVMEILGWAGGAVSVVAWWRRRKC